MTSNYDTHVDLFLGPYIHSTDTSTLQMVSDGLIGVKDGKILVVDTSDHLDKIQKEYKISTKNISYLSHGEFLMPGLIDTHIHAPQFPNCGLGMDLPLLEWLNKYTFPLEMKYADINFARDVYRKAVGRTLLNGTTTASYFATIHLPASKLLADIAEDMGQRAFIGKVNMDTNSPPGYVEETQRSLQDTEEFVQYVLGKKNPLVQPVITPRFAISCTRDLLSGLGQLAKKYNLNIQSHLSENKAEVKWAKELFPEATSYADIYDKYNLLTNKSIMAHCVHLEDQEVVLLSERGSGIAHCPVSNFDLKSGICPAKDLHDNTHRVGLGTDVAGGHFPSILGTMRGVITASNALGFESISSKYLTYKDAIYFGTLGGAKALHIDDTVGNFQVGKEFDALHINLKSPGSPVDVYDQLTLPEMVQKFIMLGDDRNIVQVFVNGKRIKSASAMTGA